MYIRPLKEMFSCANIPSRNKKIFLCHGISCCSVPLSDLLRLGAIGVHAVLRGELKRNSLFSVLDLFGAQQFSQSEMIIHAQLFQTLPITERRLSFTISHSK